MKKLIILLLTFTLTPALGHAYFLSFDDISGFYDETVVAAGSSPTLIANVGTAGTVNGVTTSAIDTTGANFIVINVHWYDLITTDGTLTDSKSNTWTPLTKRLGTGQDNSIQLFYSFNPTVGTNHTFTYNGTATYPSIEVQAWNNLATSPFDVENWGEANNTNVISTGSVTCSQANGLLIAGLGFNDNSSGAVSINSSFTISNSVAYSGGNAVGSSMAYKILTAIGAENPQWNITNNSNQLIAQIACFKY